MRPILRKLPLIAILILASLIAAHLISFARYPTRCTASLSRRSALVGEKVTYSIHVMARSDIEIKIGDANDALRKFRIIDSGSSTEEFAGRSRSSVWYILAQYKTGEYTIGPAAAKCRAPDGTMVELKSESVTLTVKSALGGDAGEGQGIRIEEDLAGTPRGARGEESRAAARRKAYTPVTIGIVDIRGPVGLITATDIVLAGAELGLLLFLASWVVSFARRRIEEAQRVTPYEAARKELEELKKAAAKESISPQECCARTASMLKLYVKDAFRAQSSELTTAEFLKEFQAIGDASDDVRKSAADLLSLCDLVKFSGYAPSRAELEAGILSAETIIASLHERETEAKGEAKA